MRAVSAACSELYLLEASARPQAGIKVCSLTLFGFHLTLRRNGIVASGPFTDRSRSRPKAVRLSQDPQGEGGLCQGPIRSSNGGMSWGESGLGFEISNTGEASGSASRPAAISSSSPEATWSATSHQTLPHVDSPGWTVGQVPPVVPVVTPIHSEAAKSNQSQSPLDVLSRVCGGLKPGERAAGDWFR